MTTTSRGGIDRKRILEAAASSVTGKQWRPGELADLLRTYYRQVADDDLAERTGVDLAAAVITHQDLAAHRLPGEAKVRVFTPTLDAHGWHTGHTVVEIVVEDLSFLVDSVTNALLEGGTSLHLVVHPVLWVQRDQDGNLVKVLGEATRPTDQPDAVAESWMYVEIDRTDDPDQLAGIADQVSTVLQDVRHAVQDWQKMAAAAASIADGLVDAVPADLREQAELTTRLLRWLIEDNFTFLGYREYELAGPAGEELRIVPGTGLGILREDRDNAGTQPDQLVLKVREKARERVVLILTKANSRSTVHRSSYLDYVGVKTFDADGNVIGERRFIGLFTSAAYTESVRRVPVLAEKVDVLLEMAQMAPDSHSGRDLLTVLEGFPRDELFQTSAGDLLPTLTSVVHLQERRRTRLFLRADDYGRFVSAVVYLPRDRFNTAVRLKIEQILRDELGAATVDYSTHVGESVLARLYYVLRPARGRDLLHPDPQQVEARVIEAARSWEEDLQEALAYQVGDAEGARLYRQWVAGFPDSYRADVPARVAVSDLHRIEEAIADAGAGRGDQVLRSVLYEPLGASPDERRFKLFRTEKLSLTAVLPYFGNLGLEVVDERPYEFTRDDGITAYVYDFGLRDVDLAGPGVTGEAIAEAFQAAWAGNTESDGLDQLVISAGLSWRQVVILRAYTKYLRQTGTAFSQEYLEEALLSHVALARLLVEFFESRFNPDSNRGPDVSGSPEVNGSPVSEGGLASRGGADTDGGRPASEIRQEILAGLDGVASLDFDRILRSFLATIAATVRTSFYQRDPAQVDASHPDGRHPKSYIAMKLDPTAIPDLPAPRPQHEIWVYSPRVEGVHLRFGAVARGGLRWSDRREDFRTEILGLVKAQMVKNAVIVPTGAKGGFVAKRLPDSSDREAWLTEGVEAYKTFIRALLDVTDNLVPDATADTGRRVVPPPRVRRHDGDDPYLVVAADKGTASFSDIANTVSLEYEFWLGDAFASGGSVGYDHKSMGITAKGAWESVKRHFRERGLNTQTEPFTVVGVGDMSGDVFGNGMLLSEQIKLVAAFDHRHIFLDPTPDPSLSYAERLRLFQLPRSSWADYNTELISAGGGVVPRSAKSVPITPQVAAALGIDAAVTSMTPAELMRAVLLADVDLFWNGGIGTYVKASTEDNASVGDKANDAIRVNGKDLRVEVVGEGGNLGCTQRGRIEAAMAGVRINTDAIDNSAGVDCSDHEVNIKILLSQVVGDGDLTLKQRNELLAAMTDDVAHLVLRDNYEQNVLLGNARRQSAGMVGVHGRLIASLEADGLLDRELEFLPSEQEIADRAGGGLTSPEFAVLVAYAKIRMKQRILDSDIPDEPFFQRRLLDYFPEVLQERYPDQIDGHRLRREIIATAVSNDLVNRGGITFAFRAAEETGASYDQIVRAYTIGREAFGLSSFVAGVEALDNKVSTDLQSDLYLLFRRLVDRAARWLLQNRGSGLDVQAELDRFEPVVSRWRGRMSSVLVGNDLARLQTRTARLLEQGIDAELAERAAALLDEFSLLDIAELATDAGQPVDDVATMYFAVSARYDLDGLLSRITQLDRENRWQSLARGALRDDLYHAWMQLTRAILLGTPAEQPTAERIEVWEKRNAAQLQRAQLTLNEVARVPLPDLAALSVALRVLRNVIRSGSAPG